MLAASRKGSMRRSLLLALLIVLLFVGWWLMQGTGDSVQDVSRGSSPTRLQQPAGVNAAGPAGQDVANGLKREELPSFGEASAAEVMADTESFMVRVVDSVTGAAVPHAEVLMLVMHPEVRKRQRAMIRSKVDLETIMDELAVLYRCGSDGTVALPKPSTDLWVAARKGASFGTHWGLNYTDLPELIEIRITPAVHVTVHVEDETGTPLEGVTVAFLSGAGEFVNRHTEAITDKRGDAEMRHLELAITDYVRTQRNRIVAMLPFPELPGVDFRPDAPPRETVRIVVPRCGSAVVEVLDLAGEHAADGMPITLQRARTAAELSAWKEQYGIDPGIGIRADGGAQHSFTVAGFAHFPHVPVASRVECFGSPDGSGVQVAIEADGPLRPGEEVRITLRQTSAHPRLTGRVVDASGSGIGEQQIGGSYWRGWPNRAGTRQQGLSLLVDAESRFSITLDEAVASAEFARILALHRLLEGNSRAQMAWIFVPERVPERGYDVGDVMLGGPIAVAGRVERSDGSPVPGARVGIQATLAPPSLETDAYPSLITRYRVTTNEDGRFAFEGSLPGKDHLLQVSPPEGGKIQYLPFTPDASELRIVLQESGEIAGRLLLDKGILGTHFRVEFGRTAPRVPGEMQSAMAQVEALSGEFNSGAIAPGTWMVAVLTRDSHEYVAKIEGVEVRAGEPVEDPRLQVDLRGRVFRHQLTVLDADGGRPEQLSLAMEMPSRWTFGGSANPADFCSSTRVLHGFVGAEGWGQAEFHSSGGETLVRLARGIPVRIELEGDGLPPVEEGLSFTLRGNADPASGRPEVWFSSDWLTDGWTVRRVVPSAGRYSLRLELRCEAPPEQPWNNTAPIHFDGSPVLEFEVAAGATEQVVPVEITAAMAKEAHERVARGKR